MGGKAIQKIIPDAVRVDRISYEHVATRLASKLSMLPVPWHICRQLHDKQDFGDIDVVIGSTVSDFESWIETVHMLHGIDEFLRQYFLSVGEVHNTNVVSWGLRCPDVFAGAFQVDFIFTSPEDFGTSCNYYAYNDLNLFVGTLYHSIGMKFGSDGLNYTYRDDSGQNHKICVSKDINKIYSFAGLDVNKYYEGFADIYEVFEYVSTSRLFNPSVFMPEALNSVNRKRNQKRKNYELFTDWLATNYPAQTKRPFRSDPKQVLEEISEHFSETDVVMQIRWVQHMTEERRLCSDILSGRHIKQKTGLSDRALAGVIQSWQAHVQRTTGQDLTRSYLSWGPNRTHREFDAWYGLYDLTSRVEGVIRQWDQQVFDEIVDDISFGPFDSNDETQRAAIVLKMIHEHVSKHRSDITRTGIAFEDLLPILRYTKAYVDNAEVAQHRLVLAREMLAAWRPTPEQYDRLLNVT